MSAEIEQAATNALAILDALEPGTDIMQVWYEIGRAAMTLRMALPHAPRKRTDPQDTGAVQCLDCGWRGQGFQLKAQACPVCDGRVADEGAKELAGRS